MTVVLVDAKNALFRFGFAYAALQAVDGTKTGAIYGLLNCLLRLKKKYKDAKFVMVWDGEGKGWRYKLFPAYKGNRKKGVGLPIEVAEILNQIDLVKELTAQLGILQVEVPRLEADDLIALLAVRCLQQEITPVVYSSDKDFMQLMRRGVVVIRDVDKKNKLAPESTRTVEAKFGCSLKDILKVRAIAGDTSDGIPNPVRGIGAKTAAKLIAAGLDPSSGCMSPAQVEVAPVKLVEVWGSVHVNYQIMRLVTSPKSERLSPGQRRTVKGILAEVISRVQGPRLYRGHDTYQKFIAALAGLEMVDALDRRYELWRLQG